MYVSRRIAQFRKSLCGDALRKLRRMIPMQIAVLSCRVHQRVVETRIRATAESATLLLCLRFPCPTDQNRAQLRELAYDEALKYLDVA